ncbi:MAG: TIM barrel protein [Planctomycetota bacterium]|jgi:sugar phosphate isomerase/epimerase
MYRLKLNGLKSIIVIGVLIFIAGCGSTKDEKKLVFKKYTNLKLGFTTQNFIKCVPVTLENAKKFVDYAESEGYSLIELRDPNAVLTLQQCQKIADYARSKNIEIAYAIQRGILDSDFDQIFARGVKNAPVFTGPKTIRAITGCQEYEEDENKKGWTAEELDRLVKKANKAAKLAKQNSLQLVLENAFSALKGDSKTYYGISDLFAKADKSVDWQFDTGNFFIAPRVDITSGQVEEFLVNNIGKLHYIHLKTARNTQAQDALGDNELDFDIIFSIMSKHNIPYVAIELNALEDEKQMYKNHDKSIEYLKARGFIVEK